VGSRSRESAERFARTFGPITAHASYENLLADAHVQVIYIATPHPMHAEWAIKAARAGKHILCEKPLTLNHAEALRVAQAARENGVFLMEAFMYRCHPQTARLIDLIRSGAIGQVGTIHAVFSSKAHFNEQDRHFNNALGGGGILDLGCYAMSISRLIAGISQGLPFSDPEAISGFARFHPQTGTDLYAVASARFPDGILAHLSAGVGLRQSNDVRIFGTEGRIEVPKPFVISKEGGTSSLLLTRGAAEQTREIAIKTDEHLYALEADSVGDAIAQGKLESQHVPVADSLGNMAALDAWRGAVGLIYDSERLMSDADHHPTPGKLSFASTRRT
jgi:predicted dehydrogenase